MLGGQEQGSPNCRYFTHLLQEKTTISKDNNSIAVGLFALRDSAVTLHPAERLGQKLGKGFVVHLLYLFGRNGLSIADFNLSAGRKYFLMSGPAFEGTINNHGENGSPAAFGQQSNTPLERGYPTIGCSRGFGEKKNGPALFQSGDDRLHGGQIRPAPFDRYGVDRGNHRPKERVGKK
jgi:hypothetical protein